MWYIYISEILYTLSDVYLIYTPAGHVRIPYHNNTRQDSGAPLHRAPASCTSQGEPYLLTVDQIWLANAQV